MSETTIDLRRNSGGGSGDGPSGSPFDAIRHEDEHGEYWLARELQPIIENLRGDPRL